LSSIKKEVLIEEAHLLGKLAKKLRARHENIAELSASRIAAKIRGRFRYQMLIKVRI